MENIERVRGISCILFSGLRGVAINVERGLCDLNVPDGDVDSSEGKLARLSWEDMSLS